MSISVGLPNWQAGTEEQGILREGAGMLDALEAALGRWEVRRLLGGAYDRGPAMMSIQVLHAAQQGCAWLVFQFATAVLKKPMEWSVSSMRPYLPRMPWC